MKNGCPTIPLSSGSASTTFLFAMKFPAAELYEIFEFEVKPSQEHRDMVLQRLQEFLIEITAEFQDNLISSSSNAAEETWAELESKAQAGLEDWKSKLRVADECVLKAEHCKRQLNAMRGAYYKEIFHLREQLHQKTCSEIDGNIYEADDFAVFDPVAYMDGGGEDLVLKQKADLLRQLFEEKKLQCMKRVADIKYELETSKMLVSRKDNLLAVLRQRHGYDNDAAVEQAPAKPPTTETGRNFFQSVGRKAGQRLAKALSRTFCGQPTCSCGTAFVNDARFCHTCGHARAPTDSGTDGDVNKCPDKCVTDMSRGSCDSCDVVDGVEYSRREPEINTVLSEQERDIPTTNNTMPISAETPSLLLDDTSASTTGLSNVWMRTTRRTRTTACHSAGIFTAFFRSTSFKLKSAVDGFELDSVSPAKTPKVQPEMPPPVVEQAKVDVREIAIQCDLLVASETAVPQPPQLPTQSRLLCEDGIATKSVIEIFQKHGIPTRIGASGADGDEHVATRNSHAEGISTSSAAADAEGHGRDTGMFDGVNRPQPSNRRLSNKSSNGRRTSALNIASRPKMGSDFEQPKGQTSPSLIIGSTPGLPI